MQRALGASEPPGFPMIKSPTLPHKEPLASTQKEKGTASSSQEDITKPDLAKNNVPKPGEPEDLFLSLATKNLTPSVTLSDKSATLAITKADEKILDEKLKGQPTLHEEQAPKQDTSPAKPTLEQASKKQEHLKDVTTVAKPSLPTAPEPASKKQEPLKDLNIVAKPSPPKALDQDSKKQEPLKDVTTVAKPSPSTALDQDSKKREPLKDVTTVPEPSPPTVPEPVSKKQEPLEDVTIVAKPSPQTALDQDSKKLEPLKNVTTVPEPSPPTAPEPASKKQEPLKDLNIVAKPSPPKALDQDSKKQEPLKDVTTVTKPSPASAPGTDKSAPQKQQLVKPLTKAHQKAGTSPAKSTPPSAPPPKQDSGGFFGFGAPKSQPSVAQSAGSVTGKMFGFGSSFLSSASTFITSAVQDESKTTPPTPRKMSAAGHVSPKTTPPASPKSLPGKDAKPLKTEEKMPAKPQQAPPAAQAKMAKAPAEIDKAPTDKLDLSICPLCKGRLNLGSKDPPNYNTCTQCKTTVCSQCGFNPKPNMVEVNDTRHD